jgi:uncharacterized iron-regulated protein
MATVSKLILTLGLMVVFLLSGTALAGKPEEALLYDTVSGRSISLRELGKRVSSHDILIFGEYHDSGPLHRLETAVLSAGHARSPQLAVSLEMFERDVQAELDGYLAGEIAEPALLERARPWKNYGSDYRPIVEFAKARGLPVLAANIPRAVATQYARQGSLDGVHETLRQYLPKVHRAPDGEYKRRFFAQMQGMNAGKSGMKVAPEQLQAFYQAQCLKDDTMAESIAMYHQRYPGRKIIHYQGDFHSRYRLGVVEKLQALAPALRILVITPVYVDEFDDLPGRARSLQADGDIVVFVKRTPV